MSSDGTNYAGAKKTCLGRPPLHQAKAVAQDRWSLIKGCTQKYIGININVSVHVCLIYTDSQALYYSVEKNNDFVFMIFY